MNKLKNMKQCAWCKKIIDFGMFPISHGICPKCRKKVEEDIKKIPLRAELLATTRINIMGGKVI